MFVNARRHLCSKEPPRPTEALCAAHKRAVCVARVLIDSDAEGNVECSRGVLGTQIGFNVDSAAPRRGTFDKPAFATPAGRQTEPKKKASV